MGCRSHESEHDSEQETASPQRAAPVQAYASSVGSLAWASAVGNHAVQRFARRSVARESLEDEAVEEADSEAPAAEEAAPEVQEAAPEGFEPHEAAGLEALDELPEDQLAG